MRILRRFVIVSAFWLASMSLTALAQMTLQSSVFGGGGGAATDGRSLMAGTIAQAVIGPVVNSSSAVGQGFWYTLPKLTLTGVPFDPGVAGSGVRLHQNVPNPFRTTTEIAMDIPQGGHVSLKLYDGVGREVRTLIDGIREAGRIRVNVSAEQMESGHYTARLIANGVTRTITMLVVQ